MKATANLSKITPPRLPHVLQRSRLLEEIREHESTRLLLILGQAAQGKSTLAASYVGSLNVPTAWVNLDRGDSDPVNLFYSILDALQYGLQGVDFSTIASYPSEDLGPRSEIPLYRQWVQGIFGLIKGPVQLILDGLDRLQAETSSFVFLQTLAREAPANEHLIMLSREEPPFGLQDLKVKQELHVLTNDDLAFTLDETGAFFRDIRGMNLPASQVAKIHRFTEGWPGGLILFSEALEKLPKAERETYLAERMPERFAMEVFQFFGEELLASQPPPILEFLVKSSILDKIELDFVQDFMEAPGIEEVLQDAARRNLFVQSSYEEGKGWVFRYHQLFRDFLLLKFRSEIPAETRRSLFFKAGTLYEQRGRLEEAIKYFLKARAYERAVPAIEKSGLGLVRAGRTADLAKWLKSLLKETIQENPWLLYYLSMTRRFTAADQNVVSLHRALILFEKREDTRGRLLSLASLIEASVYRGRDLVPLSQLLAKGQDLLSDLDPDRYLRERATLWLEISFGLTVRGGNPRKAYWACQNAYLISRDLGEISLQIEALLHAYRALVWLGEFSSAEEKLKEIEKLMQKNQNPEMVAFYHHFRFELPVFRGDLEEAETRIRCSKEECERLGLSYLYPITLLYDLLLKPSLGRYREAEEIGGHLLQFSTSIHIDFMTGLALLYLGRSCYFEGNYDKAREFIQKSRDILAEDEVLAQYHLRGIGILNGLLWKSGEQNEAVVKDLQKSLDHFSSISSFFAIDAHFATALLAWRRGDMEEAATHAHAGFAMALEKGYMYFLLISPQDLAKMCSLAIELGDQEDSDYAARLLSTDLASLALPELERLLDHPDPKIRGKASEIRLTIHREKLPLLNIETLGRFRVGRADSAVPEEEWHGSQAKNLLKAVVALGGEAVRKEVLIESLWPDSSPDKSEKTFKVALHRLRGVLEPEADKSYGYSYVHQKDNRIFLDKDLCEVDTDKFLALIRKGEEREERQDVRGALSFYRKAVDAYKGDFLPEDLYVEWAELRREELKQKHLGLLFRIARIYEDRGASTKAISFYKKVVESDPLAEEAYRSLMVLYAAMGRRNEALKTFKACEKALRDMLDTEPEAVTVSLYKKIETP